jgi:hypothetical protein
MKPPATVLAVAMLAACSPGPRIEKAEHTGDLGAFILQSVARYGGHARTTNALPQLPWDWTTQVTSGADYLGDEEELLIRIAGNHFAELESFLAKAFGQPPQPVLDITNGLRQGTYPRASIGVALQFWGDDRASALVMYGKRKP